MSADDNAPYNLGSLPKLKSYTLNGPATYTVNPIIWIEVQDTQDTMEPGPGLVQRLCRWCVETGTYATFTKVMGGGQFIGAFETEDAPKVTAWLKANGVERR